MSRLILAMLLSAVVVASAFADEVVLVNGDRISGKVVRLGDGKLRIKTDYSAKPVVIDAAKVKSIKTDAPVEVHMAAGDVINGKLATDEKGAVRAEPAGGRGAVVIDWGKVKAINPPKVAWHGSVTIGAMDQGGNTERGSISLAAEAERRTARDRFNLRFLWNYAEEDGLMSARNVFGAGKYDWFFTPKIYGYVSEELLSDTFRDLELRAVSGVGVGWQVIERDDLAFSLEAGVSHVSENFEVGEDESRVAARGAAGLRYKIFGKVTIADTVVYLPSMEDAQYQVRNEASLSTALGAGWSLKLAHVFEYDSDPPPDVRNTDRTWILGLQYKF